MNRMNRFTASTLALLAASPALAQDPYLLDPIIVSGGFTPISAATYGRAVSVVTEDELEERGILTVQDALRALPGVSVNSSGASMTSVRIRGGESNNTLILIDGVPAAAGDATYNLSALSTAAIERIEVLRGPQSVYYGSDASSGVVNIITKTGGTGSQGSVTLEGGSAWSANGFYSARNERGGISLSLSYLNDRGWDYSNSDGELDGTVRRTAQVKADYFLTDELKLGFSFRRSDETYEYDAAAWAATDWQSYVVDDPSLYSDVEETTASLWAEYAMFDGRLTHRLSYDYTHNEQSYSGGAPTETDAQAVKYRVSYGLDGQAVALSDHVLTGFAEYSTDSSSTNPLYERETRSYALEYRGQYFGALDVQGGLRYDDNKTYDDILTWNLAAAYSFANGTRLHASAGKGSVNPSYTELFGGWGTVGNPALLPETNIGYDIGVEVPVFGDRGSLDVTWFSETLSNEITYYFDGTDYTYMNETGESTRRGIEVTGNWAVTDALDMRLAYTWLDAKNPDGSVEVRRPEHELGLGATLDTFGGRGTVSADLRYVAGNYDTQYWGSYAVEELPAFATVDVAADYRLNDTFTLKGRVTNLFNSDAMEAWGYVGRPRSYYVGIGASF